MAVDIIARVITAPVRHAALFLTAITLALAYGIWYAYSVFLVALFQEFGWKRSVLAGAFSTFAVVHGSANPLIGIICDRVRPSILIAIGGASIGLALWYTSHITSPFELYLGFGLFTALSVACCGWVPAVVLVQRRYQHRLGLALGIVSSGVGVGMLIVVPACQLLIDELGWRMAYRILGLSCAGFMLPAATYLYFSSPKAESYSSRSPTLETASSATSHSVTPREAFRTSAFWLMFAAFFFGSICSQTMHVHQVAFLVDHGITAIAAASVVSVVGLASIIAKIGGGWLSDRIDREIVFIASTGILVLCVAVLLWVGEYPSVAAAYLYGVLLGVGYSAVAAITPAMVSDRFSGKHYGTIFGGCLMGSALGSALGPWMAGALFDLNKSYTVPFLIAATCGVVTLLSAAVAYRLRLAENVPAAALGR